MIPANLLPEGTQWCVAGGYAACPALAGDIDVWVYGVPVDDIQKRRTELLAYVQDWAKVQNVNRPHWPERRYQVNPQTSATEHVAYEHTVVRIEKVAVVESPSLAYVKPIHIMVTDAYSPGEIMQGFDVSTHAVAIESTGRVWRHINWTAPHKAPEALLNNQYTEARIARIAKRFGHEVAVGK